MKLYNLEKLIYYFLVFISLVTCDQLSNTSMPSYRCGIDTFKPIEVSIKNVIPINPQNPNYKRTLDNVDIDGFKEFKIHLELRKL